MSCIIEQLWLYLVDFCAVFYADINVQLLLCSGNDTVWQFSMTWCTIRLTVL